MPEWVVQIAPVVVGGVAVYAAIRADLAALRVIAQTAGKRADDAHNRIDVYFDRRGKA